MPMLLDLSLEPDRIDHISSPLKWSILLQYFNLSVVDPIRFHAFNLLFFPASSLQTDCEISWRLNFYIHAALSFYISLEQAAHNIISTVIVTLMIHWFLYQMLGNLLSNSITSIMRECKRNCLGNGIFLYHLSPPLCLFLKVCVVWSLIHFVLWTLQTQLGSHAPV